MINWGMNKLTGLYVTNDVRPKSYYTEVSIIISIMFYNSNLVLYYEELILKSKYFLFGLS